MIVLLGELLLAVIMGLLLFDGLLRALDAWSAPDHSFLCVYCRRRHPDALTPPPGGCRGQDEPGYRTASP
jgi:hypothetical protein